MSLKRVLRERKCESAGNRAAYGTGDIRWELVPHFLALWHTLVKGSVGRRQAFTADSRHEAILPGGRQGSVIVRADSA
jgi:hypothetical protein